MASVFTVSQVTSYIKNMFTQDFALNRISIRGEVSNCKYHTSGHIYFTLKDGGAQIAAVMFAGQRKGLSFTLQEGQEVVVKGTVDVYERDGRYQLYAREITREGIGDLFARYEKLRTELEEMGMFDSCYKRPIPRYARTIGIVTARTGAKGIETLDRMGLDLLIVGRGGGSIEDLWAFNEEIVARAIFNCTTPVISAVGHETDVTIADYVADLRAPTPSAAAELAVFDHRQFEEQTALYKRVLERSVYRRIEKARFLLEQCRMRLQLKDPVRMVNDKRQRLADLEQALQRKMKDLLETEKIRLKEDRLVLERLTQTAVTKEKHRLALASSRLDGLSPLKKLGGGYGFIQDERGKCLRSAGQVKEGEEIRIYAADGRIDGIVKRVEYS